jgi:hypothetical protein
MHDTTSGPTEIHDSRCYLRSVVTDRLKMMPWMMAMFVAGEAQEAKVEVRAVLACHKFMLRQFW